MNVAAHNDFVVNEKRCSTCSASWMMATAAQMVRAWPGDVWMIVDHMNTVRLKCQKHKYPEGRLQGKRN